MKRIVSPALLALATVVVAPTRPTPIAPSALARVPAADDGEAANINRQMALQPGFAAGGVGQLGQSGNDNLLLALAPATSQAYRDGSGAGFEPRAQGEENADAAVNNASLYPNKLLGKADGTTPEVAASATHDSATPMSPRTTIVSITPAMRAAPEKKSEPRQIYAGLIEPEHEAREQRCLAEAVYFEARSEVEEGRAAIAQVVLNRVKSGVYPASVCAVVYQNRHRKLACQFTFACEGKALRIAEPESWKVAVRIAREVYEGKIYIADVGGATHYHANYVQPTWAKKLKKMDVIGRHIFYS